MRGSDEFKIEQAKAAGQGLRPKRWVGQLFAAVQHRDHPRPDVDVVVDKIATDKEGGLISGVVLQARQFQPRLIAVPGVARNGPNGDEAGRSHGIRILRRAGPAEIETLSRDIRSAAVTSARARVRTVSSTSMPTTKPAPWFCTRARSMPRAPQPMSSTDLPAKSE